MRYKYSQIEELIENENIRERNSFITGATGFVGGHFTYWRTKLPGAIYLLVRGSDKDETHSRVIESLQVAAECYEQDWVPSEDVLSRLHVLTGDVCEKNCGLSPSDLELLQQENIEEFWHCAADMAFLKKHRDRLIQTNVGGTSNLMKLAKSIGIRRFVYISTAYTAGAMSGKIREEIHSDQRFTNCYEESKHLTELAVRDYCEQHDIDWRILRPTIVMGPISNGKSGGTRFGAYGFCQTLFQTREILANLTEQVRLKVPNDALLNPYAVDQVVFDFIYLMSIEFGKQRTYHLSNPGSSNARKILRLVEQAVGLSVLDMVEERDSDASSMEVIFDKGTQFAQCYFESEKEFDRALPHSTTDYDLSVFDSHMREFVIELREQEIQAEQQDFRSRTITSWDSHQLNIHLRGDDTKHSIVFVNAYGMPLKFAVPLSKSLSRHHHFLTWDSRWVPGIDQDFELDKCHSLTHVKDLISALDALNIEKCSIVGWSSGAQICLHALAAHADRFDCGVLLNSGVSLQWDGMPETEYQKGLRSLFPKLAKSRSVSKMYCDLIYGDRTKVQTGERSLVNSMLGSLEPELMGMTSEPFKDPESLYRYANMLYRNFDEDNDAYTTNISVPMLVYGSEEDEVTHVEVAKQLSERLENCKLVVDPSASHFDHYTDLSVGRMILDFVTDARSH